MVGCIGTECLGQLINGHTGAWGAYRRERMLVMRTMNGSMAAIGLNTAGCTSGERESGRGGGAMR